MLAMLNKLRVSIDAVSALFTAVSMQITLYRGECDEFTNKHAHCVEDISSDRCRSRPVRMGISKKTLYERHPSVDKAEVKFEK